MSYTREDDRHYRTKLASIHDKLDELRHELHELRGELHDDDSLHTGNARAALSFAASSCGEAQGRIDAALLRLPAPIVGAS